MLPQWRDEVGVYLAPGGVLINRMSRGFAPQCTYDASLECATSPADWSHALQALAGALAEERWQHANARVVIGDSWARYATAPVPESLHDTAEQQVHARLMLEQIYGDTGDEWEIRISRRANSPTQVICALPRALLREVRVLLAAAKLRLKSIEPQLVAAYNCWRTAMPEGAGWFVSIGSGSLAAARVAASGWDTVRTIRISSDLPAEIHRLQLFSRLAAKHQADGKVYVDAPLAMRRLASSPQDSLQFLDRAATAPRNVIEKLVEMKATYA